MPTQAELDRAAKEVVARSRLGDQNATGMIMATRNAAQKGNPKAARAFRAIEQHAKATAHGEFGGEGLSTLRAPMIVNPRVSQVVYTGSGLGLGGWFFGPIGALIGGGLGYFLSR